LSRRPFPDELSMIIYGTDESKVKARFETAPQFRKITPVRAVVLKNDVEVETLEGIMQARKGDYLVSDDEMTHCWPVKKAIFERTYEVIRHG